MPERQPGRTHRHLDTRRRAGRGTALPAARSGRRPLRPLRPWTRLGGCAQLPLVLVAGLSYEPTSDTITAATMGRGVYALKKATDHVRAALSLS